MSLTLSPKTREVPTKWWYWELYISLFKPLHLANVLGIIGKFWCWSSQL